MLDSRGLVIMESVFLGLDVVMFFGLQQEIDRFLGTSSFFKH